MFKKNKILKLWEKYKICINNHAAKVIKQLFFLTNKCSVVYSV